MTRRRLSILAAALALLGLCVLALTATVRLRTDLSFAFPESPSRDVQMLVDRLQSGPASGLILLALSGGRPDELVRASNRLAELFEASGRFQLVANGRPGSQSPGLDLIFEKRYLLNPPLTAADFSADSLRRHLEETLLALGTASGLAAKRLLPADPTGRTGRIAAFWAGGTGPDHGAGIWLSRDESRALMMVQSTAPAFDLAAQAEVIRFMRRTFDGVKGDGPLQMDLTGPSVFATATSERIGAEMKVLTAISVAAVLVLLFAAFRSLSLLLVLLLPLGFGICAGAAVTQLAYGYVHGLTLAFGGTLIGVAVDYPVHLVGHATAQGKTRDALEKIWHTLRLGALTTMAAFLPITLSSFPGLSQLGVFAIVGLLVAALVTRTVLPAVLAPGASGASSRFWPKVQSAAGPVRWARVPLLLAGLAAVAYLGFRHDRVWESDLRNLSPTTAAARELDRRLRADLGAADVRYFLVVRQASAELVLRKTEDLAEALGTLVSRGDIAGFDAASRYLPSVRSQRARQARLPDRPALAAALTSAQAGLPFRAGLFEPFLDAVARSRGDPPLTLQDFRAAGLGWRLDALLFPQDDEWVGLIVPSGVARPAALVDFVAARGDPALSYLDLKAASEELVTGYRREALGWLVIGAAVALVMLWLGLRSPRRLLLVAAPVVLSVALTAAVLSLLGTAFSLFHLLSFLLVAGVGLDYALFFDRFGADPRGSLSALKANTLCATTTVTVFTVLAFSQIPVLHGIGSTVALGAAFALLSAFVFTARGTAAET